MNTCATRIDTVRVFAEQTRRQGPSEWRHTCGKRQLSKMADFGGNWCLPGTRDRLDYYR